MDTFDDFWATYEGGGFSVTYGTNPDSPWRYATIALGALILGLLLSRYVRVV